MKSFFYSRCVKPVMEWGIRYSHRRPNEVRWMMSGIAIGGLLGVPLGGVGITFGGSAVGVSGVVLLAIVGGVIGSRLGLAKDMKKWAMENKV